MCPIVNKREVIDQYVRELFPNINADNFEKIVKLVGRNFKGGYSPNSEEWPKGVEGVASGVTLRMFVAVVGESTTGVIPVGINDSQFWEAVRRCTTI